MNTNIDETLLNSSRVISDDDILKEPPGIGQGYGDFYNLSFYCGNCGKHNHRYIRKGVRKPQSIICDNCGCDT